jgi:Fic family protein
LHRRSNGRSWPTRKLLRNLEQFLHVETDLDPLVRMAVGHYQFEAIHPFSDGNGRTGRLLNVLFLMNQGLLNEPVLYLSRYLIQHKGEYYRLLRAVTEQAEWEPWILYMLEAVRSTSRSTLQHILAIRDLLERFAAEVRDKYALAYSKELVELLFDRPYCKVQFLVEAGIAKRQTAAKYLKSLVANGFLSEVKIGRENVYINTEFMKLLSKPYVEPIDT